MISSVLEHGMAGDRDVRPQLIHDVAWWGRNHGPTDLDNLIGLCPTCHHLVHARRLTVTADGQRGFTYTRQHGRHLHDEHRTHRERIRRYLRRLRRHSTDADPHQLSQRSRRTGTSPAHR